MKSLLWITDPHLDRLSDGTEDAWFENGRIDHSGMIINLGQSVSVRRLDR
jgi:hypothetical protein